MDADSTDERIIESNRQRIKTTEQKAREAAELAEVVSEMARIKHAKNAGDKKSEKAKKTSTESASLEPAKPIHTDVEVAKAIGVGRDQARDLMAAGTALVEAEKTGDEAKATEIKEGLSKSAAAGFIRLAA